jgi:exopolysaccharide biosynthesis operon protein EpsL
MRFRPLKQGTLRVIRCVALLALAMPAGARADDGDAVKFVVFGAVTRDSNVFRLPAGIDPATLLGTSERSDVITNTGVGVMVDRTIGRQRLLADLRGTHSVFSRFNFLDNDSYDGKATLQWVIGNDWSGDLGYSRSSTLTSFADFRLPVKNMQTTERPYALARYRLAAPISLRAQLSQLKTNNSTADRRTADRDEVASEIGADFLARSGNTTGGFVRYTDGTLPNRVVGPAGAVDQFTEIIFGSNFNWRLNGMSAVSGYLGYTKRSYDQLQQRNFGGASGRVAYEWVPTGKLGLSVTARRQVEAYEAIGTAYALTNAINGVANWKATEKINFSARAEYRERDFLGDSTGLLPGQVSRQDKTRSVGLTATYAPLRHLEIAASVNRESRSSNRALLDYDANVVSLTAQFVF